MNEHKEYNIPNKLYFRIGEVSDIVGVKPYVLRYWESEFGDIKPSKSKSGQRLYKRKDVETLLQIKELLYDYKFTIDGARRKIKDNVKEEKDSAEQIPLDLQRTFEGSSAGAIVSGGSTNKLLAKIKMDLEAIKEELGA